MTLIVETCRTSDCGAIALSQRPVRVSDAPSSTIVTSNPFNPLRLIETLPSRPDTPVGGPGGWCLSCAQAASRGRRRPCCGTGCPPTAAWPWLPGCGDSGTAGGCGARSEAAPRYLNVTLTRDSRVPRAVRFPVAGLSTARSRMRRSTCRRCLAGHDSHAVMGVSI
jgi:hypothetical protein